jgi:hypothetical protein
MSGSRTSHKAADTAAAGLTPKQDALLAALLAEPTLSAASRRARVSEATARRWLAQPGLQHAYREARRHIVEHSLAALQRATDAAVVTLQRNLSKDTPPAVQVRAASIVIDYATKAVELVDLAARVEALERLLSEGRRTV